MNKKSWFPTLISGLAVFGLSVSVVLPLNCLFESFNQAYNYLDSPEFQLLSSQKQHQELLKEVSRLNVVAFSVYFLGLSGVLSVFALTSLLFSEEYTLANIEQLQLQMLRQQADLSDLVSHFVISDDRKGE